MPREPFPDRGPDDPEPGSSGWRRVDDSEPSSDRQVPERGPSDSQALGQGLFVCLPAEELTLAGFAQDGRSDTMAPGALLAALLEAITGEGGSGLAGVGDDQLVGVVSAARRMESRAAWTLLAALAELARRRPAGEPCDDGEYGFSEFAADEVAAELHLSRQSATEQIWYARQVAGQLPACFAALHAGTIHPVHLRIIADETAMLGPEDMARADAILAGAAGSLTFGQLRSKARRLVLRLDPDAARKRKEQARQDARVRRFREDSGNAGMEARELPPDEVLASWQHVEQRALDLRAAGMSGPLADLRVQAYLDLLQERDSRLVPAGPDQDQAGRPAGPGGGGPPGPGQQPAGRPGPGPRPGRDRRPGSRTRGRPRRDRPRRLPAWPGRPLSGPPG